MIEIFFRCETIFDAFILTENLRLNNRHHSGLLTNGRVSREHIRVLGKRNVRWRVRADVEDATPLGKVAAAFFELLAALCEAVEALRCALAVCARERHDAQVEFYARKGALSTNEVDEAFAFIG